MHVGRSKVRGGLGEFMWKSLSCSVKLRFSTVPKVYEGRCSCDGQDVARSRLQQHEKVDLASRGNLRLNFKKLLLRVALAGKRTSKCERTSRPESSRREGSETCDNGCQCPVNPSYTASKNPCGTTLRAACEIWKRLRRLRSSAVQFQLRLLASKKLIGR